MIRPTSPAAAVVTRAQSTPKLLALFTALFAIAWTAPVHGASPSSATITPTSTPIPFTGTATGGASAGETSCVDGANCDVFTLTVAPGDYTGKIVKLNFTWTLPATDYDFYIHKDKLSGNIVATGSNGGAPATTDQAAIDPNQSGTGVYVVHVVYFSSPGLADEYRGTASIAAASTAVRTATYTTGAIKFTPNVPVKAPVTTSDGEPSSRTDFKGNFYTGGIRGFPAGVDLWLVDLNPSSPTFDPNMRLPIYRGQPDAFSPTSSADLGGDGGGDIDLAVGFSLPTGQTTPTLAFSSLIAANLSSGNTKDRGATYNRNAFGNVTGGIPADDRQWHEFLGANSVYLLYRTLEPAVTQIQRSNDGGFTYGAAQTVGAIGQTGSIDVHQATGTVYVSGSTGVIGVGTPSSPTAEPLSTDYKVRTAATDPNGVAHLFFVTKVADDGTANGTLYACYSNDKNIYLKSSKDKGVTWTDPVQVNDPNGASKVNLFPWMETGPTPGSVGVVWYGTSNATNSDAAEWKVYFAQSLNADTATPAFEVNEVTEPEHYIHGSNISEGGLTGSANRNLLDYFQISFDPQGAAVVSYTDDHNDFFGNVFVARQISGPSIKGGSLPTQTEGTLTLPGTTATVDASDAFPPRQPGVNGEQVTDFANDVVNGLLVRAKAPSPLDIVSARYDTSGTGATLAIAATLKVSDLSTVPPDATWRMPFTANAPHSVLSATGTYTYGVSDHGDMFYLEATTSGGTPAYNYGKAVRGSDGSLTYTRIGAADAGNINQAGNVISVQVSVAKLNAALASGRPPIGNGSVITGLRARTNTSQSGGGQLDQSYGGTQFVVHDSAQPYPPATPTPSPYPVASGTPAGPTPAPVELVNISTRVGVLAGDQAGIGGFIIRGTKPKRILIRGLGPSVAYNGTALTNLSDPALELRDNAGVLITSNDNWRGADQAEITASGLAPKFEQEAAIVRVLNPGNYTAILRDAKGGTGVGLIEVYDINADSLSDFGNISTRGNVATGDNVLIGGFIIRDNNSGNSAQKVVVRALGPSLTSKGVQNALQDPVIELHDANGTQFAFNDNWRDQQQTALQASSLAPTDDHEAAILATLNPGAYTAVVRGRLGTVGVGLVEVYNLGAP